MEALTRNPTELLRIVNMAVGGVAIAGGVGSLLNHSFSSIIIGIYEVIAGAMIIFLEVRTPTEEHKELVHRYASFMHSFVGRGVFYLLLGVLMLNYYTILYICGTLVGAVGVAYIVLHFFRMVEPPSTMQAPTTDTEAQPVWQGPTE
ncbi:Golgi apparatus membrane protein TVP15 [Kockovaella imperatae]|uniref:Golgi apparatus membrane protein TVP15 n=1 Tax=Kockovaella imperatae TaxID=4999 RepID=A0A1Y1U9M7_9TREE|nr:Golgi apparatus membrane protein TVP15 [Kockovaella imperatae]ORX33795.1 Golgi apparatus membrane protein TVP15 [Kockovaella imperatae]